MSGIQLKHTAALASVLLLTVSTLVLFSTDVFAGFEWKSSASKPAAAPAAPAQEPIVWERMPGGGEMGMPSQRVVPVESMPVPLTATAPVSTPAPVRARASVPAVSAAPAAHDEILSGFGSDLPIIIAVQQIVPAGHNVFVKEGVSPNTTVSWRGGKSWEQVLADALSPAGLAFKAEGNSIAIGYSGDVSAVAAAPAPVKHPAATKKVDMIPADMLATNTAPTSRPASAPVQAAASVPTDKGPVNLAAAVKEMKAAETAEMPPLPPAVEVAEPPPAIPVSAPAVAAPVTQLAAEQRRDSTPVLVEQSRSNHPVWLASRGRTLRDILKDWSKAKGVDLYWAMDYDYRMDEDISYSGGFEDAVARLIGIFSEVRPQPFGALHVAKSGPQVLVVNSYDLAR